MPNKLHDRFTWIVFAIVVGATGSSASADGNRPDESAFVAALDRASPAALAVAVIPSPKLTADDFAKCLASLNSGANEDRMSPMEFFKSQAGLGDGFDDSRSLIFWLEKSGETSMPVFLVPVTDAKVFLDANFTCEQRANGLVYTHREETDLFVRTLDHSVLVSYSQELVNAYAPMSGLAATLQKRLGKQGFSVMISGDAAAWVGPEILKDMATDSTGESVDTAEAKSHGVTDVVLCADFESAGVAVHTFVVSNPTSPLATVLQGGPPGEPAQLSRLPRGPFIMAAAADVAGLGGGDAFLQLLALLPGEIQIPEWVRENKSLMNGAQFSIYPSKLGVMGGGLLNEAYFWCGTDDSAKAKQCLRDWMHGLAGVHNGMDRTIAWEDNRVIKDELTADAFAVTDSVVKKVPNEGGETNTAEKPDGNTKPNAATRRVRQDPMERIARSLVFGPRGAMGFVKTFKDGMLVTFSQRPDVLRRGMDAAQGGEALQGDPAVQALRSHLTPQPDIVAYIGVASVLKVVGQAARSFPDMGIELPYAPPSLAPIAMSIEIQDGHVESTAFIPSAVLEVFIQLYHLRTDTTDDRGEEDESDAAVPNGNQVGDRTAKSGDAESPPKP